MRSIKALSSLLLLAACDPTPGRMPSSAAPIPRVYSCEQSRQAAKEFAALPKGSTLEQWMDDYRIERKALRAFHQIPEPDPCT